MKQPGKTAKEMWDKYKNELMSGNPNEKSLNDIKQNLDKDHWEAFADFSAQNLSPKARQKLSEALVKLEDDHSPNNYLLRSNSLARMFFMYDNPEMDKDKSDQIKTFGTDWVENTNNLITDDKIKLLMSKKVGRDDIASVAFFNTVNASATEVIMKQMQQKPPVSEEDKAIFLGMLGVMKGDAKITKPHTEILNERFAKMEEVAREKLKDPELTEKLDKIKEARTKGTKCLTDLKNKIDAEHEIVRQRFTSITHSNQIDDLGTKLYETYKKLDNPISKIDNNDFKQQMLAARETMQQIIEKAKLDKEQKMITPDQYDAIVKKVNYVKNINTTVENNYNQQKEKHLTNFKEQIDVQVTKLTELDKKIRNNPSSKTMGEIQKDITKVKNNILKLQEQVIKDKALTKDEKSELTTGLTSAMHIRGMVKSTFKDQQPPNKFQQFVSGIKNRVTNKPEQPQVQQTKQSTPKPLSTKPTPDNPPVADTRRYGRRF